jgi:nucleoside-diphosphate-sugar epimerase
VVVTGSSGLIGTRVVADLARDHRVVGLDVTEPPPGWAGAEHIACDLTSDFHTADALARVRREHGPHVASVVHLAAYYDFSGEPSPLYRTLTVEGTRRLLRMLGAFERVEQLVYSSTLLVMKPTEQDEALTEQSPVGAQWDYPRSKLAAEAVIRAEHRDVHAVILRIAGAYDEAGHSPPLTQHLARVYERRLESYFFPGDPTHGQPFVHLQDLVDCFRLVIENRHRLDPLEIFLVAEPDVMSYEQLQDRLGELIHGKEWPTIRVPVPVAKAGAWIKEKLAPEGAEPFIRPWMVDLADENYPASIRRIHARIGWAPKHRLREVLPEMIRRLLADPIAFYDDNGIPLPEGQRNKRAAP